MKSTCPNPIVLKNGTVVPCGHCEICNTHRRLEWQYRLRIHLMSCDQMPMFITLTYDNYHLPLMMHDGDVVRASDIPFPDEAVPTVYRPDMSAFIKEYKRRYGLRQEEFQYFGCQEYGDLFDRPHGHLILFGDKELYWLFMCDTDNAQKRVRDVWKYGNVHVCVAGYDGMAYVTKYCLKSNPDDYDGIKNRPFTIGSNGLGMNFLKSLKGRQIMSQLQQLKWNLPEIIENMPVVDFYSKTSIKSALEYLRPYVPDFTCVLDDGTKVFLPRAIRKKMTGSFEHFKDNPLWLYRSLENLLSSIEYYELNGDHDSIHRVSSAYERSFMTINKIRINKNISLYNKNLMKQKYESVR